MTKIYVHRTQESVNEKCWRLISCIFAQYDISKMVNPWQEPDCIFGNQFNELFEITFFKELIELAAILRALLDINDIKIKPGSNCTSTHVGSLIRNKKKGNLSFREACNKIIHSKTYEIEFLVSKNHPLSEDNEKYKDSKFTDFKNPIIITEGDFQGKEWVAHIQIIKFFEQAMYLPEW